MPTTERNEQGRIRLLLVGVLVLVVGAVAVLVVRLGAGPLPDPEGCRADVGDVTVELSTTQAQNAALIAAIAVRRGLPARAASIALAAAFQESKLENLTGGDRDSVGLFQQRPSQGWGTRAQILDPPYAINRFYDALTKVDGYQSLPITVAAQRVQRSGYPDAYEQHEAGARALASALTGWSPAKFSCVVHATSGPDQKPGSSGLTPRAARVRADLEAAFGPLPLGGFARGGVTTGHLPGSAHDDGRAIDVFVRPADAAHRRLGWAIAAYLVAQASRLGIQHVIFDGRIWTAGRSSESGWRAYHPPTTSSSAATTAILEHRDHVHVDVGTHGSN
ncbi:MAG: hypothetical protein QOK15_2723 [Nocardioidaceae bacterium]|nr:hypothetical protein [Nocardioidaceae bacterium]